MKMPKGALWGKEARFMLLPYPFRKEENIMKRIKKIAAILLPIILAVIIGYFVFTGSKMADSAHEEAAYAIAKML